MKKSDEILAGKNSHAILITDVQSIILFTNESAYRIFDSIGMKLTGFPADEIIGPDINIVQERYSRISMHL